jgi:hypothetical protein
MFFDLMCVAPFLDGYPDSMARQHHIREIAASYRLVVADDTPDCSSSPRGSSVPPRFFRMGAIFRIEALLLSAWH